MVRRLGWLLVAVIACKSANVNDAEIKGDVKYLAADGTPDAVSALGRLADKNPAAATALEARPTTDLNVYLAAWQAVLRGADWGSKLLRAGLADASRAELAATAMTPRHDPHVAAFATDLDGAVGLMGKDSRSVTVPGVLASIGSTAQPLIEKRLADPATRDVICRGLASTDASQESRATFMRVPASSRDSESCLRAASQIAQTDDAALAWLGSSAEVGLLTAAGKNDTLKCERLTIAWQHALADRPADQSLSLTVPLSAAIKRCAKSLDPVIAPVLEKGEAAGFVVAAIDPGDPSTGDLKTTCARLPLVLRTRLDARLRERASDALSQGCARSKP
jgi:hypothetical protein